MAPKRVQIPRRNQGHLASVVQWLIAITAVAGSMAMIWQFLHLPGSPALRSLVQWILLLGMATVSSMLGAYGGTRLYLRISNWVIGFVLAMASLITCWIAPFSLLPLGMGIANHTGNTAALLLLTVVCTTSFATGFIHASVLSSLCYLWGESSPFSKKLNLSQKLIVYPAAVLAVIGSQYALTSFFPNSPLINFWLDDLSQTELAILAFTALLACREGFQRGFAESYVTGMVIGLVSLLIGIQFHLAFQAFQGPVWSFQLASTEQEFWQLFEYWRQQLKMAPAILILTGISSVLGAMAYKDFAPTPKFDSGGFRGPPRSRKPFAFSFSKALRKSKTPRAPQERSNKAA